MGDVGGNYIVTTFVTMNKETKRYRQTIQTTLSSETISQIEDLKSKVEKPTRAAVIEKAVNELYIKIVK